jgi:hypothetical protein
VNTEIFRLLVRAKARQTHRAQHSTTVVERSSDRMGGSMGRVVKFSVVDAKGVGVGGQTVTAGEASVTTTGAGAAQALLDDGHTVITVNGVKAYEGPVGDLRPVEVFSTAGKRLG